MVRSFPHLPVPYILYLEPEVDCLLPADILATRSTLFPKYGELEDEG